MKWRKSELGHLLLTCQAIGGSQSSMGPFYFRWQALISKYITSLGTHSERKGGGVCQGDLAYHCRGRYAAISIAHCATLGAGKEPQGMILFVPLGKTTRSVAPDSYRAGHQLRTSAVFPGTIHSTLGGGRIFRKRTELQRSLRTRV